jgi:hypothetical protein
MSRPIAALFFLLLAQTQSLVAQDIAAAAALVPGTRVGITTRDDSKPRVAVVVARTADTLQLQMAGLANTVAVPLAEISRLDVSTGRHRNVYKGMIIGVFAGGAGGALLGAASYQPCTRNCLFAPSDAGDSGLIGGIAGGALGLVVGSLIGSARVDDWKRVAADGRRVAVSVEPRARGVGVALRF